MENTTKGESSGNSRWADDFLNRMRTQGDELADHVIADTFAHGDIKTVNQLLESVSDNDDEVPEALPDAIEFYFRDTAVLPDWADKEKIAASQQFFFRYGAHIITLLFCKALPVCYAAGDGAQVLYFSERIHHNTRRRITETAQFIVDVMSPNAFDNDQYGFRSCQKVRIMHAAVRYHLRRSPHWNMEWGLPINQEDLVGTSLAFSWVVLEGLKQIGVDLTEQEEEDFLHTWNVISYMMGVSRELLPKNMQEAGELANRIAERHHRESEAGKVLTKALVEVLKEIIPGTLFDNYVETYMRYLNGDQLADMLDIPKSNWTRFMFKPLKLISNLYDDLGDEVKVFARLSSKAGIHLMKAMLKIETRGKRVPFHIPSELGED